MTGGARGEAERIVHDFQSYAIAYAEGNKPALGPFAQRRSELVAALAAAIEVDRHRRRFLETGSAASEDAVVWAEDRLREALSALRARDGEETGDE